MYCPSCEHKNSDSNTFCSVCGFYMKHPLKMDFTKKRDASRTSFTIK